MAEQSVVFELEMPTGGSVEVVRHRFGASPQPRVAIVSGIRGDAPEGMRIALALMMFLQENLKYEQRRNSDVPRSKSKSIFFLSAIIIAD